MRGWLNAVVIAFMFDRFLPIALCGALLAGATPAWAAPQCPSDIDALLAHLERSDQYAQMTFEVSHTGEADDYARSERYEPWREPEQRWVLLQQDGEIPDAEAREKFATRRAEQGNPLMDYLDGIDRDQIELLEQTETRTRYRFQPDTVEVGAGGDNALNVSEHVRGTLVLLDDDDIGCVLNIQLSNPKSFSPRTGVRVKTFSLTSRFTLDDETGLFFPESMHLILKGRAFLVAGFDVLNRAMYSAVGLQWPAQNENQSVAQPLPPH